jgi:ferredoxin
VKPRPVGPTDAAKVAARALEPFGILTRGVVLFDEGGAPLLKTGEPARAVLLLGNVGGSIWPTFDAWRAGYNGPDPLDTWSKSVILPVAEAMGATAYFPSDPPWQPFQRWAMQAEGLRASPLGLLIHPQYGLWHGYRGALGFPFELEVEQVEASRHPCDSCVTKPCLSHCPADAVTHAGFDVSACRLHLRHLDSARCRSGGCHARNACPVGAQFRYPPEQLRFHMEMLEL